MKERTTLLVLVAFCITFLLLGSYASTIPADGSEPGAKCVMGGGVIGTCEDMGECLRSGGIIRREGVIKICTRQFSTIYVCCRKPHLIAKELCDAWSHYWRQNDGRCSIEHPLIVGGKTANIGEFPHVALLGRKYRNRRPYYNCGATLISPHYLLTAAHCLLNHREGMTYWVKLGEHDIQHDASSDVIETLKGPIPVSLYEAQSLNSTKNLVPVKQIIEVENQFIHPSYNFEYKYHDIALLKLKTPAKLTRRVLPACLPHEYPMEDYLGKKMTVVGWGSTAYGREMSRTLQKVDVPVIDRLTCSTTDANSPRNTPLGITEDMLCAGEKGKDSCKGDSGGPLSRQNPRNSSNCEHTIVGVVSYGIGSLYSACGVLGVYTRVSFYLDWITGYIAPHGTSYLTTEDIEGNGHNDTEPSSLNFTARSNMELRSHGTPLKEEEEEKEEEEFAFPEEDPIPTEKIESLINAFDLPIIFEI